MMSQPHTRHEHRPSPRNGKKRGYHTRRQTQLRNRRMQRQQHRCENDGRGEVGYRCGMRARHANDNVNDWELQLEAFKNSPIGLFDFPAETRWRGTRLAYETFDTFDRQGTKYSASSTKVGHSGRPGVQNQTSNSCYHRDIRLQVESQSHSMDDMTCLPCRGQSVRRPLLSTSRAL